MPNRTLNAVMYFEQVFIIPTTICLKYETPEGIAYSQRITADEAAASSSSVKSIQPLWEDFITHYFQWIDTLHECERRRRRSLVVLVRL